MCAIIVKCMLTVGLGVKGYDLGFRVLGFGLRV